VVGSLHKSKLQVNVEILCSLSSKGPLKTEQISDEVDLSKHILKEHLEFLYDRGLIGEQNLDHDEKAYFITDRGLNMIKVMGPMVREAQRLEVHNLERISRALAGTKFKVKQIEEKKPRWKRIQEFIKDEILSTEED
jgi:predicted ArsR family transcriptional regulator